MAGSERSEAACGDIEYTIGGGRLVPLFPAACALVSFPFLSDLVLFVCFDSFVFVFSFSLDFSDPLFLDLSCGEMSASGCAVSIEFEKREDEND